MSSSRSVIFLLSPANLAGIRARFILGPKAGCDLARRLRQSGVPLGELFSFVSNLYFRGKLAYARTFSLPPQSIPGSFIITATGALLSPETVVSLDVIREMAAGDIDARNQRYRVALDRSCRDLSEITGASCNMVLLGSLATPKYTEPLLEVFGERLLFPGEFAGRGNMSRGGLLLRCVATGQELTYIPVLSANRDGPKPAKLPPARPVRNNSRRAECHD